MVVLRAGGLGYSEPIGRVDVAGLRAAPFLRLTLSTADTPYLRPNTNPFAVAVLAGSTLAMPTTSKLR